MNDRLDATLEVTIRISDRDHEPLWLDISGATNVSVPGDHTKPITVKIALPLADLRSMVDDLRESRPVRFVMYDVMGRYMPDPLCMTLHRLHVELPPLAAPPHP